MPLRFTVTLLLAGLVVPASAQMRAVPLLRQLKQKQKQLKQLQGLPSPAVERFLRMSPQDRERALSQLPPERRQQMEQRLRRLEQLTPEQRAQLDRRYR